MCVNPDHVAQVGARGTLAERFWSFVQPEDPTRCWLWRGHVDREGYGSIRNEGKKERTHRVSFFLANGRWPDPCALHTCDVRNCVNPAHLYEGTQTDNGLDTRNRKRNRPLRGEANPGAKLVDMQVIELRQRYADGESLRAIARSLGVSSTVAGNAAHGRTYQSAPVLNLQTLSERRAEGKRRPASSKLDAVKANEIRALFHTGRVTISAIAKQFGVSRATIYNVLSGRLWTENEIDLQQQALAKLTKKERLALGLHWRRDPLLWVYSREDGWRVERAEEPHFTARAPNGQIQQDKDGILRRWVDPDEAKHDIDLEFTLH